MKNVLLRVQDHIAYVSLNRPQQLNALNLETLTELNEVFDDLTRTEELRCIILTGAGEKAFAAGADTIELERLDAAGARHISDFGNQLCMKIQYYPVPVIAAVNGYALGGGCELAMSCDIRIASEHAVFGLPETSLGIYPGWGGTQRLARITGYGVAAEMIFAGKRLNAKGAQEVGLVNRVCEDVMTAAEVLARQIAANAPLAVRAAKRAMLSGLEVSLEAGVELESEGFSGLFETEDCRQGLNAFNHRKKYQFKGQ